MIMNTIEEIKSQKTRAEELLRYLKDGWDRCNADDGYNIKTVCQLESLRMTLNACSKTSTLFERLFQSIQEDIQNGRGITKSSDIIIALSRDALLSFKKGRLIELPSNEEILSFLESHEPMIEIEPHYKKESIQFDTLYQSFLADNGILIEETSDKTLHWNQAEYNRLSVCLQQCIHTLDLQCSKEVVHTLTQLALSSLIGWCMLIEKHDLSSSTALLKHLFDEKSFILQENKSSNLPFVLCTVDDNLTKSETYVGIKFKAEIMIQCDVHSKLEFDQIKDIEIKCILSQDFSIFVSKKGEMLAFNDCSQSYSESQQQLLNEKQIIDLDQPVMKLLFKNKQPVQEYIELRSPSNKKPLRELIQTMTKAEELRDTQVIGWRATNAFENTDWLSESYPALIQFNSLTSREVITSISCSSCHLIALTQLGSVYSCGIGSEGQLGLNSTNSVANLELIGWFLNSNDKRIIVTQISAGGDDSCCHSAAIDESGRLYTWGSALVCGHGFAYQRHIVCPRCVDSLENINVTSISCGNGFSLAIGFDRKETESEGKITPDNPFVFSWGKAANGRLGFMNPIQDNDAMAQNKKHEQPFLYEKFPRKITHLLDECIVQVSAGNAHALALTKNGDVFAWGSNAFGQCTAVLQESQNSVDYYYQRQAEFSTRYKNQESKQLCSDVWIPKKVPQLGPNHGKPVSKICAGSIHSACISNGSLYTWGGGGLDVLGHGEVTSETYGFDKNKVDTRRNVFKLAGHLILPSWTQPRRVLGLERTDIVDVDLGYGHGMVLTKDDEVFMFGQCSINKDSIPISSNLKEFQHVKGKAICKISCGGPYSFYVSSGDLAAAQLGKNLYNDISSVDCNIMISGKMIPCHKIILAMRSSTFNDLLGSSSRSQFSTMSVTDLFVSNEHYDVLKDLISFIYKDSIADLNTNSLSSTLSLCRAAARFKVSGLVKKCQEILKDDFGYSASPQNTEGSISTFATDLCNALNDTAFCDVKIISIDESTLTAHKCILRSRSSYFETCFHSLLSQADSTIRVPFSSGSLRRILFYIYTYRLKDGCSQSELIEDISNAYFINLQPMVQLCESELKIVPDNALQILSLSLKIESSALKLRSMQVIVNSLAQQKHLDVVLSTIPPDVKDDLFNMIKKREGVSSIIPRERKEDAMKLLQREWRYKKEIYDQVTSATEEGFTGSKLFILLLVIFATYTIPFNQLSWLTGPIVPIVNTITIIIFLLYLIRSMM